MNNFSFASVFTSLPHRGVATPVVFSLGLAGTRRPRCEGETGRTPSPSLASGVDMEHPMNAAVKRIELRERWHERLEQTKVAQREHAAHVALGGTRPQPRSERRVTIRSPPQSPRGGGSGGGGGGCGASPGSQGGQGGIGGGG